MVWTEITRPKYRREGLRYASDTTDEEWAVIAPYMPGPRRRGRPRTMALRAVTDAIFYIAQSGCRVAASSERVSAIHDGPALFLPVAR